MGQQGLGTPVLRNYASLLLIDVFSASSVHRCVYIYEVTCQIHEKKYWGEGFFW